MLSDKVFSVPQIITEVWTFIKGLKLPEYTIVALPDATRHRGEVIFVSDATTGGGTQFRASDGVAWRNLG